MLHFALMLTLKSVFESMLPKNLEMESRFHTKYITNSSSYLNERNSTHTHIHRTMHYIIQYTSNVRVVC